ncbi:hypothetical protein GCM10010492_34190 [Saccharothrix mutabilis subsp. mutabilis]|uniref:DUF4367 domain-containing protein n=1 Tax=Saccharothrix mutabilis subsp. mutabilis TaxID=66855 RepID=A0ABP3DH85_9PSEU
MAERLEDEPRPRGRDGDREPDDATVAANTEAATSASERERRFGDIGVLAAAAALLTGVTVAGVVVPWVVARDAVPATTTTSTPSTTHTGHPWRSAHCEGFGEPWVATADEVAERTGWRPPGAGTPWGEPEELRFSVVRPPTGFVVARYRVDGTPVTVERYPEAARLVPEPGTPAAEVPLAGATALLLEAESDSWYHVDHPDRSGSGGPARCSARRLMWTAGDGVGWAVTGHLSTDELVALAETL